MKPNSQIIDYRITLDVSNAIKCFAICAMLCHHLFLEHREYGAIPFRFALIGKICVALFVFISGYGVATKFQNLKNSIFSKEGFVYTIKILSQRYIKFYLNYWIIFFTMLPLGIFIFGRSLSDAYGSDASTWICLIKDFWGIQGIESYNSSWWFNRLIILLWLLFPLLYWSMKSKIVAFAVLIFLYLNPGWHLNILNSLAPGLSSYTIIFSLGILTAIRAKEINTFLNKFNPYFITILSFTTTLLLLYMRNIAVSTYFIGIKVDPFAVLSISLNIKCLNRLVPKIVKTMAFVGKHSMNMYLLHAFILAYFFQNLLYSISNSLLIFFVLFLSSLLLSVLLESLKRKIGFYRLLNEISSSLTRKSSFHN